MMSRVALALALVVLVVQAAPVHKHKKHAAKKTAKVDLEEAEKVKHDIHSLAKAIKGTSMNPQFKQHELDTLKQMDSEIKQMKSGKQVPEMKKELGSHMKEIKETLARYGKAEKVVSDLEQIEKSMKASKIAKKDMKEISANIVSIREDTRQLEEASGKRYDHLKKAISLRSKALNKQIEE